MESSPATKPNLKESIDLSSSPVVRKKSLYVGDNFKTMSMKDYADLLSLPVDHKNNQNALDDVFKPLSPMISLLSPPTVQKNKPIDEDDDIFKFDDDFFIYTEPDFDLLRDLLSSSG
ncbi:hypothetical protein KR093_006561 [Drosophila rubida]|uniref:Uncharacterized protein n=1 Tax=Drosophila rubida TaxID=30044 RepID=A0AAD4JU38_9MUSC|nr:hypothetical protein KR093_006561 [Drosophila rubida]